MAILNHKTKPPTGQEQATKDYEEKQSEKIKQSKARVREALGDNYPVIRKRIR